MVDFEAYLCKGQDTNILFIEVYHQQMIFLLDNNNNTIRKPSQEELEELKSIDIGSCEKIDRHKIEELGLSFIRLYFVRFEPRIRCAIYRLTIKDVKVYIAECYDGSSVTYRYDIFSNLEDAMAWIYD